VGVANFFGLWALKWAWQTFFKWAVKWAWKTFFWMGVRVGVANFLLGQSIGIDENITGSIDRY